MESLLNVQNLTVRFDTLEGTVHAVNGISYTLNEGETLGIVGESGSGKSVTVRSIMGILPDRSTVATGQILFEGIDVTALPRERARHFWGVDVAMIFQDPMTSLNPVLTVGFQIKEPLKLHMGMSDEEATKRAAELLELVNIPEAESRLSDYPHQFSGGMRQRAMVAIALACNPTLLIADEPTTALDVTIQAEIMDLLQELCESDKMGLILITHDLGVVSQVTENIAVMYAGKIVEIGSTQAVIHDPAHPYTKGLIKALPGSLQPGSRLNQIPGMMPTLTDIPPGCSFHPRCNISGTVCRMEVPALLSKKDYKSMTACHMVK